MKSKKPAKSNEKQGMSREQRFKYWRSEIHKVYQRRISFADMYKDIIDFGVDLGLVPDDCWHNYFDYFNDIFEWHWNYKDNSFGFEDTLHLAILYIEHNCKPYEIDFDLLLKNKERFKNWTAAILITKAISKDEATITK